MEIPQSFYIIAGTLIVANIGTVVTVFYGIGKAVWWISKLDSRVEKNTADIDAAHSQIRDLKQITKGI